MSAYWPLILVILAIAMAVGPIMLMQPSSRDKRLASLRQQAAVQGLHVRLTDYEEGKVAVYSLPVKLHKTTPSWQLVRQSYAHGIHFYQQWQLTKESAEIPLTIKAALTTLLDELPNDIIGMDVRPSLLGLWWNEKPNGNNVDDLISWLKRLESIVSKSVIKSE